MYINKSGKPHRHEMRMFSFPEYTGGQKGFPVKKETDCLSPSAHQFLVNPGTSGRASTQLMPRAHLSSPVLPLALEVSVR